MNAVSRPDLYRKIQSQWNFDVPAETLQQFQTQAEAESNPVVAAIWLTQAARAHGLMGEFDAGHAGLDSLHDAGDVELAARIALERGRLFRSAGDLATARPHFQRSADATRSQPNQPPLGGLHIDALHMLALLETEPEQQIRATQAALDAANASTDPTAHAWRASLLNNLGCALVDADNPQAALAAFQEALALREQAGERRPIQIARWMVGWALRLVGRLDDARTLQFALKAELDADGISDKFVSEELALLG